MDKGIFLKNRTTVAAKHSVWLLSMLKTVDLESVCRSQLLDGQILVWKFTKFNHVCITIRTCSDVLCITAVVRIQSRETASWLVYKSELLTTTHYIL